MSVIDRSSQPGSGSLRDFAFPAVNRTRLANGLDLRLVRMTRLPVVSVSLFMRAGEDALALDRAGLAVLTADALEVHAGVFGQGSASDERASATGEGGHAPSIALPASLRPPGSGGDRGRSPQVGPPRRRRRSFECQVSVGIGAPT